MSLWDIISVTHTIVTIVTTVIIDIIVDAAECTYQRKACSVSETQLVSHLLFANLHSLATKKTCKSGPDKIAQYWPANLVMIYY